MKKTLGFGSPQDWVSQNFARSISVESNLNDAREVAATVGVVQNLMLTLKSLEPRVKSLYIYTYNI